MALVICKVINKKFSVLSYEEKIENFSKSLISKKYRKSFKFLYQEKFFPSLIRKKIKNMSIRPLIRRKFRKTFQVPHHLKKILKIFRNPLKLVYREKISNFFSSPVSVQWMANSGYWTFWRKLPSGKTDSLLKSDTKYCRIMCLPELLLVVNFLY